jgi:hypothetical protein
MFVGVLRVLGVRDGVCAASELLSRGQTLQKRKKQILHFVQDDRGKMERADTRKKMERFGQASR